jgi:methyl-accepting chemotaxis protein
MKLRLSLAFQIAASLVVLVALVLCGSMTLVSAKIHDDLERFTTEENLQITAARADQMGALLRTVEWYLQPLSHRPELVSGDPVQAKKVVLSLAGQLPSEVIQVVWADVKGTYFTSLGATGSIADRSYFKAVVLEGAPRYVSEALISKSLKVAMIFVSVPVKAADGKVNGVLSASVSLEELAKISGTIKIGKSGYGWVIDKTGLFLAHPRAEAIMTLNATDADKAGYRGLDSLGQEMLKGQSGFGGFLDVGGAPLIAYYSPIPRSPGWVFGISLPRAEAEQTESELRLTLLAILVLGIGLAVLVAVLLGRRLVKPIHHAVRSFQALAQGEADLTASLDSRRKDELGMMIVHFNAFLAKLREIVQGMKRAQDDLAKIGGDLKQSAEVSRTVVEEISTDIGRIEEQSQAQGNSVSESSTAIEQIAQNIESLDQLIARQAASISQASSSVEELAGNIGSIQESAKKMSAQFDELAKVADEGRSTHSLAMSKIAMITERSEGLLEANKVISAIAAQTNLLAMNAAIEAAHAGEAGRGFSVVADEIRRLAETSSGQSRTIGKELKTVQTAIVEVVDSSRASESAFVQVIEKISETEAIVRTVGVALAEQEEGSSQMLEALRDMNQVSSQVQSGSREMRSGNKTLLLEIELLKASTQAISATLSELVEGTKNLNEASVDLEAMAERTAATIQAMDGLVGRFKT